MKTVHLGSNDSSFIINVSEIQCVKNPVTFRDDKKNYCIGLSVFLKDKEEALTFTWELKEAEYIKKVERFGPFGIFKAKTKELVLYPKSDFKEHEYYIECYQNFNEIIEAMERL